MNTVTPPYETLSDADLYAAIADAHENDTDNFRFKGLSEVVHSRAVARIEARRYGEGASVAELHTLIADAHANDVDSGRFKVLNQRLFEALNPEGIK